MRMRSKMLLKMAANATKMLNFTFEVQYGKATLSKTTRIRHLGQLYISRDFAHAQKLTRNLTQGRALFWQLS